MHFFNYRIVAQIMGKRKVKTNAIRTLEQQKIKYDLVHYTYDPENLDVRKIAAENDLELKQIYKTLVLQGNQTPILVALVPGDGALDLKKLASASGNKRVHMAAVKNLQNLTGYIRGGCCPIGMKKLFPVYIDQQAKALDRIYVNAGQRGILMGTLPDELVRISQAQWIDLCKDRGE